MHRRGLDWPARLAAALVTILIGEAHGMCFGDPSNTRLGVSVYLATSALFNASAIFCYDRILKGQLSSDLQHLAYWAIILNFLAWVTYMFQMSPQVVNIMITALTYGTFTRLLWVSDGDTDVGGWRDLLRRVADWRKSIHFKEAQS